MLLRSASTPIMRSCSHQPTLSPEPDLGLRIQTTRPMSLSPKSIMSMSRTSSETDLRQLSALKKRPLSHNSLVMSPVLVEEQEEMETESLLGGGNSVGVVEDRKTEKVAVGGGVVGGGSGGCWGGGGENSGHQGNESMDGYYQKMIRKYPNDGLLLVNYARFLKEVKGDVVKAEEYCERAILAKAVDGDVLSLYGDLIWNNYKDASKAQSYFDQAVQSAPNDCYVLASYAQFLWDAGEEEEEEEDHDHEDNASDCKIKLNLSKGCPSSSPLAAAS